MKLYIGGPIRGLPDDNRAAFFEAEEQLTAAGYETFNPIRNDDVHRVVLGREPTVRECFQDDTYWICRHADGIALLPGWDRSFGAKAEVALAQAIGIPHNFVRTWITEREPVKV